MNFNKRFLIGAALFALMAIPAFGQFYSYRSFINGYNLYVTTTNATASASVVQVTNVWGGTNVYTAPGINAYVYPGVYPTNINLAYIASNSTYGAGSMFGLQTNTSAIVDPLIWPDNNSDVSNGLGVFVSITGVNNLVTNAWLLTFATVVDFPILLSPPSPNSSVYNYASAPLSPMTNQMAMTSAINQFTVALTANGLTPVMVVTNPPTAVLTGAARLRLLSVASTSTNSLGIATNTYYTTTLTNGVWQNVTNTVTTTNWGVNVNAGIVGFPPFHSP